ncbi:MAG TPA: hypothetical protein VGK84_00110 [Candidatus Tumulicola sp.]|jgi:hypothetical protein
MKYALPALSLALIILPATACAQNAPSAPASASASGQRWPGRAALAPFFKEEEQLRKDFRSKALSALSSSHRTTIGNIIGSLAVSSNPDPRAAAQRIDAVLSQSERQSILSARDSFEQSSRAVRERMRAQMAQQMNTAMPSPPPHPMRTPSNDAGRVLMMALSPFGSGMMMHGHGMHDMPPNGPPPNGAPPNGPDGGQPGGAPPQP